MKNLLQFSPKGIYCPAGDFFIDPWQPVPRAVITHAHSDHAYAGHASYLAHYQSAEVLKLRLGNQINLQTAEYQKPVYINGVEVTLYPAGHVPGSAQIRVSYKGEIWVVSGDYKTEPDGLSTPFEPVPCHTFISESTFGMPVFEWAPQHLLMEQILNWWAQNAAGGKASVLFAYSLGKAQRLLSGLVPQIGPVLLHGAVANTTEALERNGYRFPKWERVETRNATAGYGQTLIIAPPSAQGTPWMKRFSPFESAVCSGWMAIRGFKRRSNSGHGFVVSDHADWKGLLMAIKATNAEQVLVTHGYTAPFSRYLNEIGIQSAEVKTLYGLGNGPEENNIAKETGRIESSETDDN